MSVIEFRTLGTLDLRGPDGRELYSLLAQPKRIALLAYLCIAAPRGFHRRDTLLGLLWPEVDQAHARASLRNALHVLRHTLGETAFYSRGDEEVGVNFDLIWCDAAAFEERIASGQVDDALDLYRGDLLTGFFLEDVPTFERWLDSERTGLRASAARATRVAAERRELERNVTGAVTLARRAVELTDTDERAVRRLVELLARIGDRAGALQAYENFERHLAAEFEAEPSAETRGLVDRLRNQQAAATHADPTPSDVPVEVQSSPQGVPGYLIEGELGRGGTSTVFLARDLKHDRPVAIKFLRPEVAAALGTDRFLAEIALGARLRHPHILPLLDSGEANGLPYYAMPHVEGETLRSRLRRERFLPLDDAIRIACDVADALGYAHAHGIIHRDIKPENILLENGHALVADFGIARAISEAGGDRLTQTGLALGTAAYMSPEQSDSAVEVDARADIYALACVLYEMLTGDPPFSGSTKQAVLARKAAEPAPPMRAVRDTISPILERNILKALSRAPADRFGTVKEFADALRSPGPTQGEALFTPGASLLTRRWGQRTVRIAATTGLAALFLAMAIWGWMRPAPSKQVVRYPLVIDSTEAMIAGTSWWGRLAISPDGSRLAYIGAPSGRLLIRPFNQLHATAIQGVEGANSPFFSPDGQHVGFLTDGHVHVASINGGSPITVTDSLTGLGGASWARDGLIYVTSQGNAGLLQVEATPRAVPKRFTVLNTASGEVSHAWPDVLPNGKGVLFTVIFNGRNGVKGSISVAIAVAKIPSGKHRVIVNDAVYARYSTSGHLLFVTTNGTLMMMPFDQNSMKSTGEPTALIEGIHVGDAADPADLAISATGTLVYATGARGGKQELVWVTRNGKAQSVDPDWTGYFWCPALSADGKRLAVARSVDGGQSIDVWVKQLNRGPSINLTLEGSGQLPTWTPDGRSVTFTIGDSPSSSSLWTKRADGGAQAVLQFREKRGAYAARWSPDGKWLIFETDLNAPGLGDILGIRPGADTVAVPLVATSFTETSPAISPDGRWLAYSSNESGQYEIYVVPFPNTGAQRWVVSTRGGTEPLWSHRGSELFYRDGAGYLVAVEVKTNPTLSLGRSTPLFPAAGFDSLLWAARYAVAPDDRRFLMIRPVAASTPDKLIVVDNWFEELKSRK